MEIKKVKKIKPMFTSIVTTMDSYSIKQINPNDIINSKEARGDIAEFQKVLAVGDSVRSIKVGDIVCINPIRYAKTKHEKGSLKDGVITDNPVIGYDIPTIIIDGKECLFIEDRDIAYVVEDFE